MKILKHGNPHGNIVIFKCTNCGCEFEANENECESGRSPFDGEKWYNIDCPECNRICLSHETQKVEKELSPCAKCSLMQRSTCCGCITYEEWRRKNGGKN